MAVTTTALLMVAFTLIYLFLLQGASAQSSVGQGAISVPSETVVFTAIPPQCTQEVFQQAAAESNQPEPTVNITNGGQLMYIRRGELCTDARMDCGEKNLQTIFSVAVSTSGSGTAQGVCSKIEVEQVPPPTIGGCRQVFNAPPNQLLNDLASPIYIGLTTTRAFVYYPLIPAEKINSVAYCYAQFNSSNSSAGGCSFPAPCAQVDLVNGATPQQAQEQCTSTKINAVWGDDPLDQTVLDHCGSEADLPQGFINQKPGYCYTSCCAQCGTAVNNTSYRRWPIGPQCQVFRVGAPQLRVFGGLVVSTDPTFNDTSLGDEVRFQTPKTNPTTGRTSYQGGLPQQDTFVSASGKLLVHVNQMARSPTSLFAVNGYVVICSGTVQTTRYPTCDMGVSNPYVQSPQPSQCLSNYPPLVSDSVPNVAPPNATPDQLGTGTVPTFNSLGTIGKCSWYFVPDEKITSVTNPRSAAAFATTPVSEQAGALWPNLAANLELDTKCPGGSDDGAYFSQFVGVPGWELDPDTNQPRVTSVCQMSHALNNYSLTYKQQYNLTGGDAELAKQRSEPAPPWLLPNYNIIRPNWWLHSQNLVFDLGLTYPHRTGLELLVQVADEKYIPLELASDPFVLAVPQSSCDAVVGNGTGSLRLAVRGLYTVVNATAISQYVQISCATVNDTVVRLYQSNGTQLNQTNPLPFAAVPGVVTLIHSLNMSFAPQSQYSPNAAPYIQCTAVLLNEKLEAYGTEIVLDCRTALGNASLAVKYSEEQSFGGSTTALYIGLGVVGAALLFGLAAVLLVWALSKSNKETQEAMARTMPE